MVRFLSEVIYFCVDTDFTPAKDIQHAYRPHHHLLHQRLCPLQRHLRPLHGGLAVAQAFLHKNRIRQAASSLGAATFCIRESIDYARSRAPFGKPLALNQGIQFPLVELMAQTEMLRLLIRKTACEMDSMPHREVEKRISHKVSMRNY
jgi:alkylation response protein AidB-like acyl-CoA dehydrogenase